MKSRPAQRRTRLIRELRRLGHSAGLITHPINVRYLTGFTGDSSYLLLSPKLAVLISDTRFETQIAEQCPDLQAEIRDARLTTDQLAARVVKKAKLATLAIEADHLTKASYDALSAELAPTELVGTQGLVAAQRAVKDADEIDAIRRSISVAERAIQIIRARLAPSLTEREIAQQIEIEIRQLGGEGTAFPPIVGVGATAALPHAEPGATRIEAAPFVLIDWGARVEHYTSDLTRVFLTGRPPRRFQRVYQVVLEAQKAAIARIRPGADVREVDDAARSVIAEAGFGKYFGHGLGHGFGLEIHELPRISPLGQGVLKPGMVTTVEPGIYLPGWGGVRIEDDILVTEDGHELLTSVPKEWEDVGG